MKKLILAATLLLSFTAQATLEPEQECELYMQVYAIVAEFTGEVVSDENPVHRGIVAGVLTLNNQLAINGYAGDDATMGIVRNVVKDVIAAPGGSSCRE